MAAKYQLITELYRRTGVAVAKNPQAYDVYTANYGLINSRGNYLAFASDKIMEVVR